MTNNMIENTSANLFIAFLNKINVVYWKLSLDYFNFCKQKFI